jgi:hypothetical protein
MELMTKHPFTAVVPVLGNVWMPIAELKMMRLPETDMAIFVRTKGVSITLADNGVALNALSAPQDECA